MEINTKTKKNEDIKENVPNAVAVFQLLSCVPLCALWHSRILCHSQSPRVFWNSSPLSSWCHPTISFSVTPFSSCTESFPASGSFPMSWLFASMAKVLDLQLQHQSFQWIFRVDSFRIDWFALLAVQGILKSILQHHSLKASNLWFLAFFMVQFSHHIWLLEKTIPLTI